MIEKSKCSGSSEQLSCYVLCHEQALLMLVPFTYHVIILSFTITS